MSGFTGSMMLAHTGYHTFNINKPYSYRGVFEGKISLQPTKYNSLILFYMLKVIGNGNGNQLELNACMLAPTHPKEDT